MSLVNTPEGVSRLNYLTSAGVCSRMTPIFLCSTKSINHLVHLALVYLDICCVRMVLHCNDLLMLNRIPFLSFLHCSKVPCCKPQWAILQKREVQWTPWWRLGLVYMARDVVLTEIFSHENQGSILYRQRERRWWEQSGQLKPAALEREKAQAEKNGVSW